MKKKSIAGAGVTFAMGAAVGAGLIGNEVPETLGLSDPCAVDSLEVVIATRDAELMDVYEQLTVAMTPDEPIPETED